MWVDVLDFLRCLRNDILREEVDGTELIPLSPHLPGASRVLVELRKAVKVWQVLGSHRSEFRRLERRSEGGGEERSSTTSWPARMSFIVKRDPRRRRRPHVPLHIPVSGTCPKGWSLDPHTHAELDARTFDHGFAVAYDTFVNIHVLQHVRLTYALSRSIPSP